jgi:hypothetical protein
MKKVLAGISVLLIATFAIIFSVHAQNNQQETKKNCTEATSKDCKSGPNGGSCCKMKYGTTAEKSCTGQAKCGATGDSHPCCKDAKDGKSCCKGTATTSADGKKCEHQCEKSAPSK